MCPLSAGGSAGKLHTCKFGTCQNQKSNSCQKLTCSYQSDGADTKSRLWWSQNAHPGSVADADTVKLSCTLFPRAQGTTQTKERNKRNREPETKQESICQSKQKQKNRKNGPRVAGSFCQAVFKQRQPSRCLSSYLRARLSSSSSSSSSSSKSRLPRGCASRAAQ
eukprot:90316-Amphidinium_carterae.1